MYYVINILFKFKTVSYISVIKHFNVCCLSASLTRHLDQLLKKLGKNFCLMLSMTKL